VIASSTPAADGSWRAAESQVAASSSGHQGQGDGAAQDLLKLAEGALAQAMRRRREIYTSSGREPDNVAALAAGARLSRGRRGDQAKQTLARVRRPRRNEPAVGRAAALEFANRPPGRADRRTGKKVAANPLDHQARFDLAVGSTPRAAQEALTTCSRSCAAIANGTRWRAQAARALFEAWGPTDEATLNGRKRLSSILSRSFDFFRTRRDAREEIAMPMNAVYRGPIDLRKSSRVPVAGACCCRADRCRSTFSEPRYLAMIDDSLRDGHRLIGMIQPETAHPGSDRKPNLYKIGCVGRITQLAETGTAATCSSSPRGALRLEQELEVATPTQCRVTYAPFADDFIARKARRRSTQAVLAALSAFLKANDLKADWDASRTRRTSAGQRLAMMSPYDSAEKQAMLEAPD